MEIEDILFWCILLFALFLLILRLKGSPSYESLFAAVFAGIGLLWKGFSDFKSETREFMGQMKEFMRKVEGKLKVK
jgi:hypothetical protein